MNDGKGAEIVEAWVRINSKSFSVAIYIYTHTHTQRHIGPMRRTIK